MVQYFGRELKIMKDLQNRLAKNNNFESCIKRDRQTDRGCESLCNKNQE